MRARLAFLLARLLAVAALAALAAGLGAHRPEPRDPMLLAFLAAGGGMADLCADLHGEAAHPGPCCDACLPGLAGLGPRPGPAARPARRRLLARVGPGLAPRARLPRRRRSPARPRAPPAAPA